MLRGLKSARLLKGLSQEELSEKSGVHRDTIHKLETSQRPARPATIKRLADTLGIGTEELIKDSKEENVESIKTEKVEVDVRWETEHGIRGETLRFRGEEIDTYEKNGSYLTLYECPGGYRVYVDPADTSEPADLNPWHFGVNGNREYSTYSVEELVKKFSVFGEAVGVNRVRDID